MIESFLPVVRGAVLLLLSSLLLVVVAPASSSEVNQQTKPGIDFQSPDIQSLQQDDFQNPGILAVDFGKSAAHSGAGKENKSCHDCHESFAGIAAEFPNYNARLGKIVSLSSQIMACREDHQHAKPAAYESNLIQSMSAYVAYQSRGLPFKQVSDELGIALGRGEAYYYKRKGQLNLACHHCHEQNAGKMLRGDLISQGVSTGYPIYRLEWQSIGSLHRRFRSCDIGVRAEPEVIGGQVYTDLELYLRDRAGELPLSAPAVRR